MTIYSSGDGVAVESFDINSSESDSCEGFFAQQGLSTTGCSSSSPSFARLISESVVLYFVKKLLTTVG